jgi:predicted deacylase
LIAGIESTRKRHHSGPDYQKALTSDDKKAWVRADEGGIVEMKWDPSPFVDGGETICVISKFFETEQHAVTAPFTGFLVGTQKTETSHRTIDI